MCLGEANDASHACTTTKATINYVMCTIGRHESAGATKLTHVRETTEE